MIDGFRQATRNGAIQIGTFVKTASHQIVEVLGVSDIDFAIVDCEHAPFDAATLDAMALAGCAADLPLLMRLAEVTPAPIGQALDMGFAGIVAPHVANAEVAQACLDGAKYGRGRRGYSPSTRAGRYGALAGYRTNADATSSVWCQIEDEAALGQLDSIAALDEIDCLFLGRADLAQSLNVERPDHPDVIAAVKATAAAGRRHGRCVGIYLSDVSEMPDMLALGITVFAIGSDQSLLRAQAQRIRREAAACGAQRGR